MAERGKLFTGAVEPITPAQFHQAAGVEDWRAVAQVASTYFRTGSFAASGRLAHAIGALPGLDDHHAGWMPGRTG
ncbi:hypothetical protein BH20ACT5_BH20ACT5_04370 [soil metagenome]